MSANILKSTILAWAVTFFWVAQASAEKEVSQDMQANMAKIQEATSPGPKHKILKKFEGDWTVSVKHWMKPADKPQTSEGTSSMEVVLGGRFLKQEFKGSWAGNPFIGFGYLGYDNIRQEYSSVWMDNMSTTLVQGSGKFSAPTKSIVETGTYACPMTGEKEKWYRSEWKILSPKKLLYTMYSKDQKGKEHKSMELTYVRK